MNWGNGGNGDNGNHNGSGFTVRGRGGRGGRGRGGGYLGTRFDPNYHNNRGHGNQGDHQGNDPDQYQGRRGGYQGGNYNPEYHNRRGRGRGRGNRGHRSNRDDATRHDRNEVAEPAAGLSNLPLAFLVNFTTTVVEKLERDIQGDHRICTCYTPNGTHCYHTIVELYANNLRQVAELQTELVRFLEFLMRSGDEEVYNYFRACLDAFLVRHPNTLLETVLQTMGRSGVVTLGNGVSTGQGTGVIFDGFETTLGAHGNRTSSGFAETTTDEDDEEDLSDYYDPRDLDDIE